MANSEHLRVIDDTAWGSATWAESLRKETKTLAEDIDSNYMLLAERLWMIYDTPVDGDPTRASICTAWQDKEGNHYSSFDRYVDAELGINYKRAQRLRAIWKVFKVDLNLSEKQLARVVKLGFSKVRELARPGVLSPGNLDSWLSKAETLGVIKLTTGVSQYLTNKATDAATRQAEEEFEEVYNGSLASEPTRKPQGGAEHAKNSEIRDVQRIEELEPQSRQFNCLLFGDQIETVNLAMRRSVELSNSDKVGHNLSLICLDFITTNDFGFADEKQKLRFLAKFEKLMGYKLVVVDPVAKEVVYGIDTLEHLAGGG